MRGSKPAAPNCSSTVDLRACTWAIRTGSPISVRRPRFCPIDAIPSLPVVYSNLADSVAGSATWPPRTRPTNGEPLRALVLQRLDRAGAELPGVSPGRLGSQPAAARPGDDLVRAARPVRGRAARPDRARAGQLEEAFADAVAYTRYASNLGVDEDFYYCEALEARCFHAQGLDAEALVTAERFLARWHGGGGFTARALELCELATVLVRHARHDEIRRAAALLPAACRWRDPLISTADRRYGDAELVYAEIGSRPLTADAQLLAANAAIEDGRPADAAAHARAVRAFAEQTGATFYEHQAARFLDP